MEMIGNFLLNYIGTGLTVIFIFVCWNVCLNSNEKITSFRMIVLSLIDTLIVTLINCFLEQPVRLIIVYLFMIIFCTIFFTKNITKSTFLVIVSQLIISIAEVTFVILASIFYKGDFEAAAKVPAFFLLISSYVTIVSLLFMKTKIPTKIFKLLDNSSKLIRKNEVLMNSIMIISIIIFSLAGSYMNIPIAILLTINILLGLVFIGIVIKNASIKANYNKVNSKYETSISSLKEYETMIDKYRIKNHENKNELMTIRNMIKAKDKKTIDYIDKLVDNKIKDNEKLLYKTSKIPEGGLRATIYSKLNTMDEKKIKYTLDVSNSVRTADLINLGDDLILNICKIIGVFLDNAIEAVDDLKKKRINIEMYTIENELYIDITNNYKGKLNLNELGKVKYTTKGDNHGYGLSLVKNIIEENSKILENEKAINGDEFTQTLKIKM